MTSTDVFLFGLAILLTFFLLCGIFIFSWWLTRRETSLSPYTGLPLRRATGLSAFSLDRVYKTLHALHQYDNRIFDIRKAAFCRETGRIFPDCITWYDSIVIDWSFIQKRAPGNYVSWGSLTNEQQKAVRVLHQSLEGFQTEFSSPNPIPRLLEPDYLFLHPGPLYVDVTTGVLVGWQIVPDTELEVLIVQKPTEFITPTLPKETS